MDVSSFIKAAKDGDLRKVQTYIDGGGDVNVKNVVVSLVGQI